jgi:hypothetical protein
MTQTGFRWLFAAVAVVLGFIAIATARADWPENAFSCRAMRADLAYQDWAERHCGRRWRHHHSYHKPSPDADIMSAQVRLQALGYELDVDGFIGPETREVITQFQHEKGLPVTGQLDRATKYVLHETKGEYGKDRSQCLTEPLHVWSGQHQQEATSKGDAQKRWMIGVQAKHGSIYMNFANADPSSVSWRCFQSQSHDTFLGKVQSGASKILGGEGYFVVCELWARPCAAPVEKAAEDD